MLQETRQRPISLPVRPVSVSPIMSQSACKCASLSFGSATIAPSSCPARRWSHARPLQGGPGSIAQGGGGRSAEASGSWAKVYPVHSTITTAGLGLGLLWFRTGGDAIQAFVMGAFPPGWAFGSCADSYGKHLGGGSRRRKVKTRCSSRGAESQDIAELKADAGALKAEIRAGRS